MPHHEHQTADVDQQPDSFHPHGSRQREIHPLARGQFRGGGQEHAAEPNEEKRTQDFAEHFAGRNAGSDSLGGGKLRADCHQAECSRG